MLPDNQARCPNCLIVTLTTILLLLWKKRTAQQLFSHLNLSSDCGQSDPLPKNLFTIPDYPRSPSQEDNIIQYDRGLFKLQNPELELSILAKFMYPLACYDPPFEEQPPPSNRRVTTSESPYEYDDYYSQTQGRFLRSFAAFQNPIHCRSFIGNHKFQQH